MSISAIINLGILIFGLIVPFSPLKPLIPTMIVADGVSLIIALCLVEIYLYRNRKLIGKQFEQFRKETIVERTFELYEGNVRSDAPLSFWVGFNISTVINALFLIAISFLRVDSQSVIPLMIIGNGIIVVISNLIVPILIKSKRKSVSKKFEVFRSETIVARRRNATKVLCYLVLSVVVLLFTYIAAYNRLFS